MHDTSPICRRLISLTGWIALAIAPHLAHAQQLEPHALTPADHDVLTMMSGALYYPIAMELGIEEEGPTGTSLAPGTEPPQEPPVICVVRSYELQLTTDSQSDNEAAVIGILYGGNDYDVTTFNHWLNGYKIYYSRLNVVPGTVDQGPLPTNSSYGSYGDPFLDLSVNGSTPHRIYNVGIMHNGGSPPSAIGLWRSDDAAGSWQAPITVASNSTTGVFLDKPSVAVSQATNSPGYVYVIYEKIVNSTPPAFTIYVTKSTNSGSSFSAPVQVATGAHVGGQQIIVDHTNGSVLAFWVDYDAGTIKVSTSNNFGATWGTAVTAGTATYNFMGGTHPEVLNGGIRAVTIPMVRYNAATNRVHLVWHESETSEGTKTDSYIASRVSGSWQPKVRVNDVAANDQFMPSIASDNTGLSLISFYDRSSDPSNVKYLVYQRRLNPDGSWLFNAARLNTLPSAATYYLNHFIGDYRQTWWNNFPPDRLAFVTSNTGNHTIAQGYQPEIFLSYLPQCPP